MDARDTMAVSIPPPPATDLPPGWQAETKGDTLVLRLTQPVPLRVLGGLFAFAFALLMLYQGIRGIGSITVFFGCAYGLFMLQQALVIAFNRLEIAIDREHVTRATRPIPWPGQTKIAVREIVAVSHRVLANRKQVETWPRRYSIWLRLQFDKEILLLATFREEAHAQIISTLIVDHLGLTGDRVTG